MVMTDEFKTNLKVFREMNGGSKSYQSINQNIVQYSGKIEHMFKNIDRIILSEQQSDQATLQIIGNSGANAITPFEQAVASECSQVSRKLSFYVPS
jgi:hypothetical protein